ncbi:hypothetical protein [Mucilaginibacter pedocola]|uniref:Prepilin-type N-terminal cleavage/methylation domain-containing protein n=1 Tax=Mucilaginibacter pedocola TaxID=1792845 RepID=A0A1S9PBN9_9SPHI|nr:hypothetical protein [Mucilaginibacter pedocola]OOQ58331.1 hypothetical protein BC343_11905 [Mucilaginibacter pedocola]
MVRQVAKHKLTASSLLEVLIAMVVIVVVFGIGMMIYSNVARSSVTTTKLRARSILDTELSDTEENSAAADSNYSVDSLGITRVYTPFLQAKNLQVVTLTAFGTRGDTLAQVQKVILRNEPKN